MLVTEWVEYGVRDTFSIVEMRRGVDCLADVASHMVLEGNRYKTIMKLNAWL